MEKWLKWAIEIQSLSQIGLTYTKNVYDRERYERLREISAEMLAKKTELSIEKVKDLFCNETGYLTPKIDTRAVIFRDNKILLVHENNGTWSLPGLNVRAVKIISIQDRNKHNKPVYAYGVCKIFVLCEVINGKFVENIETTEIRYFSLQDLPHNLAEEKTNKEQIEMCFKAYLNENWQTQFD